MARAVKASSSRISDQGLIFFVKLIRELQEKKIRSVKIPVHNFCKLPDEVSYFRKTEHCRKTEKTDTAASSDELLV